MSKKNILIAGGSGFVGSMLCELLTGRNEKFNVHIVDINRIYLKNYRLDKFDFYKLTLRNKMIEKCLYHNVDLKNSFQTLNLIKEIKPDFIINLAALPLANISNSMTEETIDSILKTTINLIECSKFLEKKPKLILSSSSMVYGHFKKKKIDENHSKEPINMYGSVKYSTEMIFKNLCDVFDLKYMIIRPSAVYGPLDLNKRVLQIFVEKACKGDQITVNGKELLLDFTYIDDIAKCFFYSIKNFNPGIYNFTSCDPITLNDVTKVLKKYFSNLTFKYKKKEKFVPFRGALSNSLFDKKVKKIKRTKFKVGIKKYIDFIKNFQND